MALVLLAAAAAAAPSYPPPASADPDWHIPWDPARSAGAQPEALRLDAAIARYRELVAAGGWEALGPTPGLAPGSRDPAVAALRRRLRASGDFTAEIGADPWFFDAGLVVAIRRFQARHGLAETGVIDAGTLAEMNVPASERLAQLEATRARWEWLPADRGAAHVIANVPAATLAVVDGGRTLLSMRTVVGHPERPTPSFVSTVQAVVFHPEWSVPRRIAVEDLLPQQQQDAGFLDRLGIRVLDGRGRRVAAARVDWRSLSADRFPYRLVQAAGPANSLGRVKLALDNPFDIYLHDSPSRPLFGLSYRTLGSGCIRLEDAGALVTWLLAGDRAWTGADTAARLAGSRTETLRLDRRIPVWILYLTSSVDADGTVHFRRDVYGWDARLAASLPR
jgi:murein L,D-transpeptidase YcbB/YkuD